ncbi:MaoC family dehydratase [Naasia aerilata]|uniref:MaoC family dehydratase n=1 Tax=Naasia aerilata TaxID=1162966 RepID=A0ABM8G8X2_9MICO|nr:MaoC family dehydratase [Naasia aerilata]BDZ44639.1 MaoC family dehydratase [Naasia aerilata]
MTSNTEVSVTVPVDQLPSVAGSSFGPSSWRTIEQADVVAFADLSGDHNPIHLDQEFASGTPFGGTIVHGYLTLSLVVPLMAEVFEVTGASVGINYGLDRLRFPAPVPVGARVRVIGEVLKVDEIAGGYQVHPRVTFEIEGGAKPACVADMVLRYYR